MLLVNSKINVQFDVNVNNLCLSIACHARYRAKAGGDKQYMQTMMSLFTSIVQMRGVLVMKRDKGLAEAVKHSGFGWWRGFGLRDGLGGGWRRVCLLECDEGRSRDET